MTPNTARKTRFANSVRTGTLVFAGIAAAGAWGAYIANRRAANAAVQQLNAATTARLYVEGVSATNFESSKEPVLFLKIVNAGPVPAEDVHVLVEIHHANGSTQPGQPNAVIIPASGFRQYDFARAL